MFAQEEHSGNLAQDKNKGVDKLNEGCKDKGSDNLYEPIEHPEQEEGKEKHSANLAQGKDKGNHNLDEDSGNDEGRDNLDESIQPTEQEEKAGTRVCTMCDESLPLAKFKCSIRTRRDGTQYKYLESICILDQNVIESYRMKRRLEWGKHYKEKMKDLRKDKAQWKKIIQAHRMANPNSTRGKQRVEPIKQRLSRVRTTGTRIINRCIKTPLTYAAFELKMKKPKYGGLLPDQSQKEWKKYQDDPNIKDDQLGIVGGEPGHERLWIPMIEQEIDDNYRKKENQHISDSRGAKRLKASTVDDFLNNKATLS